MSILSRVSSPADLKTLCRDELRGLCAEMRERMVDICSRTGGHIGAGLGVVELTVALHYVFDTPRDHLVWDVGHQGYPHKLLTGLSQAAMLLVNSVTGAFRTWVTDAAPLPDTSPALLILAALAVYGVVEGIVSPGTRATDAGSLRT